MSITIKFLAHVSLEAEPICLYEADLTANLRHMCNEAGLLAPIWQHHNLKIVRAADLAPHLEKGLAALQERPAHFRGFQHPSGWGTYENLVSFCTDTLAACNNFPFAQVWAA